MSRIRGRDTLPEMRVRRRLFAEGWRFRACDGCFPGRPDIVIPKTIIDVCGCFWHRHGRSASTIPKTNVAFWMEKWSKNVRRDRRNEKAWRDAGRNALLVWECAISGGGAERSLASSCSKVDAWAAEGVSCGVRRIPHRHELHLTPPSSVFRPVRAG